MKESDFLGICGIVAEFNPFHNGHKYLIDCAKSDGHVVCAVISGNFVQRGDTAVISKFDRAKQALLCGVDTVCELPTPWAMSTAENFAFGAISQLNSLGIDTLYFGSESGDTEALVKAAEILNSNQFSKRLKEKLCEGKTFAVLRQETLSEYDSNLSALLENPNDTLAIEYVRAATKINPEIKFKAVKRIGAMHNDIESAGEFSTATLIREKIKDNDSEYLKKFIPEKALRVLYESPVSNIENLETAILATLRKMPIEDYRKLPDISEGIENSLFNAVKRSKTLDELYFNVKTKRYTLARIRRIIISAFIGIDNTFFKKEPPYTRILGFKNNSIRLLPEISAKPIITKVSQIDLSDDFTKKVFETECIATDLYALSLVSKKESGAEYTTPIIKI